MTSNKTPCFRVLKNSQSKRNVYFSHTVHRRQIITIFQGFCVGHLTFISLMLRGNRCKLNVSNIQNPSQNSVHRAHLLRRTSRTMFGHCQSIRSLVLWCKLLAVHQRPSSPFSWAHKTFSKPPLQLSHVTKFLRKEQAEQRGPFPGLPYRMEPASSKHFVRHCWMELPATQPQPHH